MKTRLKPRELVLFEYLKRRRSLSKEEIKKYRRLDRGYQGEVLFDQYLERLSSNFLLLKDLWLSHHNRAFQLDHILLFHNTLYMFEIKNYPGEFYFQNEQLYLNSGEEIDNPLIQLRRSKSLLRQLLQQLEWDIPVVAAVVFINPECSLFQTPRNSNIILPTQINRYLRQFENEVPLNPMMHHVMNHLESIQLEHSPYEQLPTYHYNDLKKGIPCTSCDFFMTIVEGKKCRCQNCGQSEFVQTAIISNVEEFMFLFPDERVTSEQIYDWCRLPISLERIRYHLKKHLKSKGIKKGTYYIQ
ncbi:nuclease-related domain-containing protein [Gracilibacillus lacisalsi]|uniref:nuclease-related domain-containing protein n=1 Tax=Gracilibacillus lacisalsi TaxID=393087 RepID=UPI0003753108|nr:nuclease-related domain-containing protein [Gracilibacillus lacisalsi]